MALTKRWRPLQPSNARKHIHHDCLEYQDLLQPGGFIGGGQDAVQWFYASKLHRVGAVAPWLPIYWGTWIPPTACNSYLCNQMQYHFSKGLNERGRKHVRRSPKTLHKSLRKPTGPTIEKQELFYRSRKCTMPNHSDLCHLTQENSVPATRRGSPGLKSQNPALLTARVIKRRNSAPATYCSCQPEST